MGPNAGEVTQLVGLALKMKATKADFDALIGIHPTCAEVSLNEKLIKYYGYCELSSSYRVVIILRYSPLLLSLNEVVNLRLGLVAEVKLAYHDSSDDLVTSRR